ncbi:MAG: response regulator [Bacteroidia bacterium]
MLKKLLIIDSDSTTAQELKQLLSIDWKIDSARTGKIGLKLASIIQPDVIVLDLLLSGGIHPLDGWDVIKILKAGKNTKHIPVVIFSEASHKDLDDLTQMAHAQVCLSKYDDGLHTLTKTVQEIIASKSSS